ncbi:SCO family protein [Microvirga sp. BT689]|uniref:SCO family protein n=1 Tax=Microvirga arvi TaxID=2778731 RepID=UPI001951E019|nr:SCO family protein [Microvirga arvi]MBM6582463.1 SCO family protein [Microvirga arvi]
MRKRGLGPWICRAAVMLALGMLIPHETQAGSAGHDQPPVGVVLDPLFKLIAHDGRSVTRSDVRGKPFVVLFGYTNCDDVCPTSLFEVSVLLSGLGPQGDRLPVLFVTIDPENDTPQQLKTYLEAFDSRIIGLTGSHDQVAAVAAAFAAPLNKAQAGEEGKKHLSQLFFMDRYGLLARPVNYTATETVGAVAKRLLAQ